MDYFKFCNFFKINPFFYELEKNVCLLNETAYKISNERFIGVMFALSTILMPMSFSTPR